MLTHQPHQRRRGVVLDRALDQPVRQAPAVGLLSAPPVQVGEHEMQVIAARLRACAIGEELVRSGVDLARDEDQRLVRDRGDVVGNEPQEPQRAQRHGQPEAVLRSTLTENQDPVTIRQREARAEIFDSDAVREALQPPPLRVVRISHLGLPWGQWSICRSSTARWRSAADGSV